MSGFFVASFVTLVYFIIHNPDNAYTWLDKYNIHIFNTTAHTHDNTLACVGVIITKQVREDSGQWFPPLASGPNLASADRVMGLQKIADISCS